MFILKSIEEIQKMTAEEQTTYMTEKAQHEADKTTKAIEAAISKMKEENKAENEEAIKEQEAKLKEVTDALEKEMLKVKALSENVSGKALVEGVQSFISDNIDKIQALHKAGTGTIELKAVGDMSTASATLPVAAPNLQGVQVSPPSNANLRTPVILDLTTNVNTNQASFSYTDTIPKDGDYTFLGEGDTKAQIDFKTETRYASPKKTAAWIKLTTESIKDIPQLQSIANDLLKRKHEIKKAKGILNGDGTGDNPEGATVVARVFASAGDLTGSVDAPNIMDVVNACITDIFTTHNYVDEVPYLASLVMLNPIDFFKEFVSAKDGNDRPLYPTASLFNKVVVGGVTIIPDQDVALGNIFVADMSRYNTTNYEPYSVSIGWVNDDFIKNQFVILAESRFHAFVRELDKQAFIYDAIADIKTDLIGA